MNRYGIRAALALIALVLPLLAQAAPRAWLDRESMRLGETVTLNVETDARGGSEPDFSVLDAKFRRLGTSSNTQLSFVNGRQSARTLWAVALEPLAEGVIGIPALSVGNETTAPLTLTVLPMPSGGSAAAGDEVFLEVEADPPTPYVQQQVRYTVRLYMAFTLLEGQLDEPKLAGAQLRRLGQDVQYQKTLSDRRYTVVERHYALTPESSGRLEIPAPQFRGRALRSSRYGSSFGSGGIVSARGDALELQVRPQPAAAAMPWLPARALTLTDESGATATELKPGEPVTLTLRLAAQGLTAEQLPELTLPRIEGAEVYPDQDTPQTRDDGAWLHGERVRKFALVPTRGGMLHLPEIAIEWWNVASDRAERAVLPARSWRVSGGGAVAQSDTEAAPGTPSAWTAAAPSAGSWSWPSLIWPLATLLFATLWVVTLLRARAARSVTPATVSPTAPRPASADPRNALRKALDMHDLSEVAHVLIAAAKHEDPRCRHLGDVAARLDDDAQRDAVLRLEQALYRGHRDGELFGALRAAFASRPRWRVAAGGSTSEMLPSLYPERTA